MEDSDNSCKKCDWRESIRFYVGHRSGLGSVEGVRECFWEESITKLRPSGSGGGRQVESVPLGSKRGHSVEIGGDLSWHWKDKQGPGPAGSWVPIWILSKGEWSVTVTWSNCYIKKHHFTVEKQMAGRTTGRPFGGPLKDSERVTGGLDWRGSSGEGDRQIWVILTGLGMTGCSCFWPRQLCGWWCHPLSSATEGRQKLMSESGDKLCVDLLGSVYCGKHDLRRSGG